MASTAKQRAEVRAEEPQSPATTCDLSGDDGDSPVELLLKDNVPKTLARRVPTSANSTDENRRWPDLSGAPHAPPSSRAVRAGHWLLGDALIVAAALIAGSCSMWPILWAQVTDVRSSVQWIIFGTEWCGYYSAALSLVLFVWAAANRLGLRISRFPGEDKGQPPSLLRVAAVIALSVGTFWSYATMMAGVTMLLAALSYGIARRRGETLPARPGARSPRAWAAAHVEWLTTLKYKFSWVKFLVLFGFVAINAGLFAQRLMEWFDMMPGLQASCTPADMYNCLSDWVPYAKAFGQVLNFDCALLLLPILRRLIREVNLLVSTAKHTSMATQSIAALGEAVSFHRFIAYFILLMTIGHVVSHLGNLWRSPQPMFDAMAAGSFLTGYALVVVMAVIYAGAHSRIRRSDHSVFHKSHFFGSTLFFALLLSHAPHFVWWGCIPLGLYMLELFRRAIGGNLARQDLKLATAVYRRPVLCLSFFPTRKGGFKFKEGQYLRLLVPGVDKKEWHPFTISSAHEDLERGGVITLHIKVNGRGTWTNRVMRYFDDMTPRPAEHDGPADEECNFRVVFSHYCCVEGRLKPGKTLGPSGLPLLLVDGPFAAPAQHYAMYDDVLLIGAGIGLTPSSAILQSVLRHKWKRGFRPYTLRFCFVLRHSDVYSFRWFTRVLVALQREIVADVARGNLEPGRNRVQLHLFITRAPEVSRGDVEAQLFPQMASTRNIHALRSEQVGLPRHVPIDDGDTESVDLERAMLNCWAPASDMPKVVVRTVAVDARNDPSDVREDRHGHVWVWRGRPDWKGILGAVAEEHAQSATSASDLPRQRVGVCFCGPAMIGKEIARQCSKLTAPKSGGCRFVLHQETFDS